MGRASRESSSESMPGTNGEQCSVQNGDASPASSQSLRDTPPPILRARVPGSSANHAKKTPPSNYESESRMMTETDQLELYESGPEELRLLRTQNLELLHRISKMEQVVAEASKKAQAWAEQQSDNDRLLDEKSEVIRELHTRVQELQSQQPVKTPSDEELLALEEELERERRQLKEDEQSLMQQMRDMEVQMSRERAELARQRNDLQRLQSDIRHELELAARQSDLRDRLQPLQRRYQEMALRKGAEPRQEDSPEVPDPEPAEEPQPQRQKGAGLLRRWFG